MNLHSYIDEPRDGADEAQTAAAKLHPGWIKVVDAPVSTVRP
jgi:hypothetical protein